MFLQKKKRGCEKSPEKKKDQEFIEVTPQS